MSKAFTKEDSDVPDAPMRRLGVPVPAGVPNLITPHGLVAIRAELAAGGDDDRMRELADHLATAHEMPPPSDRSRVAFGATVTVQSDAGDHTTYRIVGAIEAVPKEHAIGWLSPIAKALTDAAVGDEVTLPRGRVTVVAISFA